mmetsp:Transcript_46983/g.132550  ORF Transcript_46983/g.132550 Transcript_46983/m.132550 type:complete len:358 (-) Transcript_46983:1104-2177(-)
MAEASAGKGSPPASSWLSSAARGCLPDVSKTTADGSTSVSKIFLSLRSARRSIHAQFSRPASTCASTSCLRDESISISLGLMGPSLRYIRLMRAWPRTSRYVFPVSSGIVWVRRAGSALHTGERSFLPWPSAAVLKCIRWGSPIMATPLTEQNLGTRGYAAVHFGSALIPSAFIACSHSSTEVISIPSGQPAAPASSFSYVAMRGFSSLLPATRLFPGAAAVGFLLCGVESPRSAHVIKLLAGTGLNFASPLSMFSTRRLIELTSARTCALASGAYRGCCLCGLKITAVGRVSVPKAPFRWVSTRTSTHAHFSAVRCLSSLGLNFFSSCRSMLISSCMMGPYLRNIKTKPADDRNSS